MTPYIFHRNILASHAHTSQHQVLQEFVSGEISNFPKVRRRDAL
jgi:hypothetical protein